MCWHDRGVCIQLDVVVVLVFLLELEEDAVSLVGDLPSSVLRLELTRSLSKLRQSTISGVRLLTRS